MEKNTSIVHHHIICNRSKLICMNHSLWFSLGELSINLQVLWVISWLKHQNESLNCLSDCTLRQKQKKTNELKLPLNSCLNSSFLILCLYFSFWCVYFVVTNTMCLGKASDSNFTAERRYEENLVLLFLLNHSRYHMK